MTRENYRQVLEPLLAAGDFLLNLSVDVSSVALIQLARERGALYLDTCIEPWAGGYTDPKACGRRRAATTPCGWRPWACASGASNAPTAVLTHGANPGLVSHLVKQACSTSPRTPGSSSRCPPAASHGPSSAQTLGVKVIHIAERDTQVANVPKTPNEFVNTWSVDGFVSEGAQPAELGWGTHEKHFPADGGRHKAGSGCAIYLNRPGASTRVRTWTPAGGTLPRIPDHAFGGDLAGGLLHGEGGRPGGVPAYDPLRLSPLRQRGVVGARIRRQQLAPAGSQTHHARRDHRRHRRARRAARRSRQKRLLVRLAAVHRRRRANWRPTTAPPACRSHRRRWQG